MQINIVIHIAQNNTYGSGGGSTETSQQLCVRGAKFVSLSRGMKLNNVFLIPFVTVNNSNVLEMAVVVEVISFGPG